jgi:hypothetical protein
MRRSFRVQYLAKETERKRQQGRHGRNKIREKTYGKEQSKEKNRTD